MELIVGLGGLLAGSLGALAWLRRTFKDNTGSW